MNWKECCESKCKIDWDYLEKTYGPIDPKRLNYALDRCYGIFVMATNEGGFAREIPHRPEHCYPPRGFWKELFGMKGDPIRPQNSWEYYVMETYQSPSMCGFAFDDVIELRGKGVLA